MPEYNIRVRATDNTGAFSDRDFSLNVRNTQSERFVVVSGNATYSSVDGFNWTQRASFGAAILTSGNTFVHSPTVVNGGGLWMFFASGPINNTATTTYYTSPDGVSWTTRTIIFRNPSSPNGFTVSGFRPIPFFVNGRWLIVATSAGGTEFVVESFDGIEWQQANFNGPSMPYGQGVFGTITYHNGVYFVTNRSVSAFNGTGWTSTDLISYTRSSYTGDFVSSQWSDSLFLNGRWFITDRNSIAPLRIAIGSVTDLDSTPFLSTIGNPSSNTLRLHSLCYGNGRLVALLSKIASTSSAEVSSVYVSEDLGRSWSAHSFPSFGVTTGATGIYTTYCTFFDGYFWMHAVGDTSLSQIPIRISRDGKNWQYPTMTGLPNGRIAGFNRLATA